MRFAKLPARGVCRKSDLITAAGQRGLIRQVATLIAILGGAGAFGGLFLASASAASPPSGARKLAVTATLERQLVVAFAPVHHVRVSEIGGTFPGSVFYAFDSTTHTYWAVAFFSPAKSDSARVADSFQDAGSNGIFSRSSTGLWRFRGSGAPVTCPEERTVPKAVLHVWGIPATSPACS